MTISKRDFLRLGGSAAAALVVAASPVTIDLGGSLRVLTVKHAQAKDGNGGGGGGGNGGGSGGGGGGGNGGGNGGGSGNGGGNGGGNGNNGSGNSTGGNSKGNAGYSSGAASPTASGARAIEGSDGSINVRHANGITESLRSGRYVMKDAKGRTIISRQATARDANRLSRFLR
ncbi:hypothetical protein [Rhizobium bangladeshense]|uniref:hypothetical protein n=1 Tax=Rhizobium bangladeshense TaxID=1138189 RepID=UPI001A992C64|nr:hypothetical protein [Rhizobium bangladeshense]MBX4893701.1 hypothetical protein [Rhizobium bangladeshense]MBX4899456.1 hypothetical protein [Rhizobium bangladeshense]MBX4905734.1 hypothetical protein [Rhizobium bangladeshense]MBX4931479.1 hypothetical protein [Rhizobium bangladeshense]MBY3617669.1 hypothetical protein [Rhizobium bangladeshense]